MSNLAVYQDDHEAIARMREALCKLMPGGQRYEPDEAEAIAHIAVGHGLDPFNGEVWGIKGNNNKWYGVMVGIKGLRKHARNQMAEADGSYWIQKVRVDPSKYGFSQNHRVYECHLYDTVTTQAYTHAVSDLRKAGVPYEDVIKMLGTAPKVVGVGVYVPGEHTKMTPDAVAMKRCEADALKQRFDVQWAMVDTRATDELPSGEDEWFDAPIIEEPTKVKDAQQLFNDLGFDGAVDGEFEEAEPVLASTPEFVEDDPDDPYFMAMTGQGTKFSALDSAQLYVIVDKAKEKIVTMREEGINPDNQQQMQSLEKWQYSLDAATHYLNRMGLDVEEGLPK